MRYNSRVRLLLLYGSWILPFFAAGILLLTILGVILGAVSVTAFMEERRLFSILVCGLILIHVMNLCSCWMTAAFQKAGIRLVPGCNRMETTLKRRVINLTAFIYSGLILIMIVTCVIVRRDGCYEWSSFLIIMSFSYLIGILTSCWKGNRMAYINIITLLLSVRIATLVKPHSGLLNQTIPIGMAVMIAAVILIFGNVLFQFLLYKEYHRDLD